MRNNKKSCCDIYTAFTLSLYNLHCHKILQRFTKIFINECYHINDAVISGTTVTTVLPPPPTFIMLK